MTVLMAVLTQGVISIALLPKLIKHIKALTACASIQLSSICSVHLLFDRSHFYLTHQRSRLLLTQTYAKQKTPRVQHALISSKLFSLWVSELLIHHVLYYVPISRLQKTSSSDGHNYIRIARLSWTNVFYIYLDLDRTTDCLIFALDKFSMSQCLFLNNLS